MSWRREEIEQRVIDIIEDLTSRVFDVGLDYNLHDDLAFQDDHFSNLAGMVEDEFGVCLQDEDRINWVKVSDIVDTVETKCRHRSMEEP